MGTLRSARGAQTFLPPHRQWKVVGVRWAASSLLKAFPSANTLLRHWTLFNPAAALSQVA